MQHDWATPTPLQYFAVLVQSDDDLPLLEAAASLAQDDWPELDVQQVLADVDPNTFNWRTGERGIFSGRVHKKDRNIFAKRISGGIFSEAP